MRRSIGTTIVSSVCIACLMLPLGSASAAKSDDEAAVAQELQRGKWLPQQQWWDDSRSADRRARALLGQMTLAGEVDMLHGELNSCAGFSTARGAPVGRPGLTMAEGRAGVRIA